MTTTPLTLNICVYVYQYYTHTGTSPSPTGTTVRYALRRTRTRIHQAELDCQATKRSHRLSPLKSRLAQQSQQPIRQPKLGESGIKRLSRRLNLYGYNINNFFNLP